MTGIAKDSGEDEVKTQIDKSDLPNRPPKRAKGRNASAYAIDKEAVEALEKQLLHVDCVSGLYFPTKEDSHEFAVTSGLPPLPVPPLQYWHWYAQDEEHYLFGGRAQAEDFRQAAQRNGFAFEPGKRMLDFGCSGGRVLRHFESEVQNGVEAYGCDIDAAAIEWCQKNLMPTFTFFTNSTTPHLPLRDKFLDFIYAGSVVNHIKDMGAAWLFELARVMDDGGICILTLIDEVSIPPLVKLYEEGDGSMLPKYVVENNINEDLIRRTGFINRYSSSSPWWTGVIYSQEFFLRRTAPMFDCLEIIPGLKGYQTGYVLQVKSRNR